jgi:predicted aspartyl protease
VSLSFSYRPHPLARPAISLGGRPNRPRPVILLSLIGPLGTHVDDALLDTGADETVFPDSVAVTLGIDLTNAPTATGAGFGMQPAAIRYAEVTVRIADNNEQREWKAWVGFTSAPLRQPLLGYAGFLQFFDATFFGLREEVELTVNPAYTGS